MKRCPGCASDNIKVVKNVFMMFPQLYAYECKCEFRGPWELSKEEAEAAWDRRKVIVDTDKPEKNWVDPSYNDKPSEVKK